MSSPFVHLHVHTHYSLLDGACRVDKLVKRVKELKMDSIAITDHGCMYGVVEFFNECKKEGIKPILGMEAYMAPGDRRERSTPSGNGGEAAYHLLLLAENIDGYKNLIRLSSLAYKEGFYYKPRIDKEILRQYSKGLIATSACLGGEVCSAFMKRDAKFARQAAETYAEIFGPERFFIEVQKQGVKEQDTVNPELEELAKKLGVGLVATNDVHFLNKEDHHAHDVLCCISMNKQITDEGRLKYPTEIYLKSPQEMIDACGHFDQAIENTVRIAEMCKLDFDFSKRYAPVYRVPSGMGVSPVLHGQDAHATRDDEHYLRKLCEEGLNWRYGTTNVSDEVRTRLDYELKIICMKNFCSYFLIVWDFCNFARENGIPVGARGSGVGTMVGYLLGLCNVDPIKYGLLFERFMDPSRNEMPDIDIDICQDGRQKVIEYVRKKYGHVAQIITFGTLAAKAACKDVGRVLGVPLAEVDKLTKLIPGTPGMTLDKAISQVPDLAELYKSNPKIQEVIDLAKKLEGLCRNSGVHAAGVIIADQELDTVIPMCKDKDDNPLTQFEGPIAEKCGLLKMDFLGLRTLTTLQRSIDLVKQTQGKAIDIEHIDFTDRKVLDLFCRGETKGIFQFESGGMQDLLMKMEPDRLEDLIAANALYRPGPMELIPLYCNRKHGRERVPEVHPIMDRILAETYGIMCIHEDVRVALADGSERPIRAIRRGDRVHSLNQQTQQIEVKECHGCGPTRREDGVRITLENGFSVTLTRDHKVYTFGGMTEAGELDPDRDLVAVARHAPQEKATARHLAPWLAADVDVAYLLGSLVGDGCLTTSGVTIATGRESDHQRLVLWLRQRMPDLKVHEYFHGRCWYVSLSHPALLNDPAHGNRKTRLHAFLDTLGVRVKASRKCVPEVIFRSRSEVRAAFLAGLLDSDGCTATNKKDVGVCFLSSISTGLLEDVRRLCQLEDIPTTIRKNRIQFWDLQTLSRLLKPFLLVRQFLGTLPRGHAVGWIPRQRLHAAVPVGESYRSFSLRTGIMRPGMLHACPFVKSSTAAKAGIELGGVRYYRIAKMEVVKDQQFYGMSVADHHNLIANGIIVRNCYQEQVMQVFNQLGGIELSNAYKLIKAISKKTVDVIAKFKPDFIKGTMANGVTREKAEEIFELILKFGGYGFNKSHSTRYAIVAFQTAYMKAFHPVEYMAAVLTFEMGSTEKVVEYIEECRKMGLKVLPPDVNVSDKDFTPVYSEDIEKKTRDAGASKTPEGTIRFGLCAVKTVGEKAVEAILAERKKRGPYENIYEFCERIDTRTVQRSTIDALIKCGAFSSISPKRAPLLQVFEGAFESAQQIQNDRRNGQMGLSFGAEPETPTTRRGGTLPSIDELPSQDLLKFEKDLLGFYITSHPLTEHQADLDRYSTATTREALLLSEGIEVTIGGMISRVKKVITRNGRSAGMPMAIITLEDLEGQIDATAFAETFAEIVKKYPEAIDVEKIVFVRGKIDKKRETPSLLINEVIPLEDARPKLTTDVVLKLDSARHTLAKLREIKPLLAQHKGNLALYVQSESQDGKKVTLKLPKDMSVRPTRALVEELDNVLGCGVVQLVGAGTRRIKRLQQRALFKEVELPAEPTAAPNDEQAAEEMDAEMLQEA